MSYSCAFVDAAVEYKCVPLLHGFKNEIVLNSAGRANTYSFITDFDGLTPRNSTGYSIPLEDENGEVVTYLALEELMDAAGNYSMENVIDIAQYENGQYLVTITLDEAFLADEDTVYPVTASASSTGWLYHTSMDDTHIMQGSPNTNYYSSTTMPIGYAGGGASRIFFQFVFTQALKDAINPNLIESAQLYLWDISTDTTRRTIQFKIPKNIWTASSITWNNNPGIYPTTFNNINPPAGTISGTPGWWGSPDISEIVSAMLRNYSDVNHPRTIHEKRGVCLKLDSETSYRKDFRSSNYGSEGRPNMSITYAVSSASGSGTCYGAATSFRNVTTRTPNCWGYALERSFTIEPTYYASAATVVPEATIINWVLGYTRQYANSARQILNQNSSINSNEYRVAFRISRQTTYNNTSQTDPIGHYINQYHFIVQLNNGQWADKMGTASAKVLGIINPMNNGSGCWDNVSTLVPTTTVVLAVDPALR